MILTQLWWLKHGEHEKQTWKPPAIIAIEIWLTIYGFCPKCLAKGRFSPGLVAFRNQSQFFPTLSLLSHFRPWNKSLNFIFPTKYVIPNSFKVGHWLSIFSKSSTFLKPQLQLPNLIQFFKTGGCFQKPLTIASYRSLYDDYVSGVYNIYLFTRKYINWCHLYITNYPTLIIYDDWEDITNSILHISHIIYKHTNIICI